MVSGPVLEPRRPVVGGDGWKSEGAALQQAALELLTTLVRSLGRRNRWSPDEQEEFAAEARLALLRDDWAVLRSFRGRSSLATYLTTVLQRLLLDRQRREWGRWRPSAAARRLGPAAIQLEALVQRDGLEPANARERVGAALDDLEPGALAELTRRLRPRQRWRRVDDSALDQLATPEADLSARLVDDDLAARVQAALWRHFEALAPGDRVLLRLRFDDEVPVASIARMTGGDAKRLYRRLETLLADLRRALEAAGLTWAVISDMVEAGAASLRLPAAEEPESTAARPSQVGEDR